MNGAQITAALGGRWHGRFGSARCPAHEDRNPSLSLSDGQDGRLLAYCFAGCPFDAILNALRCLGLVEGRGFFRPPSRNELGRLRLAEQEHAARQSGRAKAIWGDADTVPIAGTLGETYLRRRGITCELPDTLRFQSHGWHPSARRFPMIVARIDGSAGFGVHRTYLRVDGAGKAEIEPNRAMLGTCAGGAVRLCEAAGPLVVAEGIETGLSLLCSLLEGPATVWAALSTSGMAKLILPAERGELIVASDGDAPGRDAARALAQRAASAGWRAFILPAPAGQDWNDVLLASQRAA